MPHSRRHLPGFRFEVQASPPSDVLPRMDVACFIGFAASGPLDRPVRVASIAQFEMIFGADAKLAWDEARGEQVYAYLAPAVRAFFRNGGRLAWIIRVAGKTQTDHFPISGLLQVKFDNLDNVTQIQPAYAQARSPGSWADAVRVSTSLMSQSIVLTPIAFDPPEFEVTLTSPADLVVGDLLRLTFENGAILMCAVKSIESNKSSPPQPNQYHVTCDKAIWFKSSWQQLPSTQTGYAYSFTHETDSAAIPATVPLYLESPITLDWPTQDEQTSIKLDLDLAYAEAPQVGSLLRVNFGTDQFWLRVEDVSAGGHSSSPLSESVRVTGQGLWWTSTPAALADSIDLVERLSFELWTCVGQENVLKISDLAFDVRHERNWDALPTDLQLFPAPMTVPDTKRAELYSVAADPRFPLAGEECPGALFVPLAMPLIPDYYLTADALDDDALTRDGLKVFDAGLFLDLYLADVGVRDLINTADVLRYQAPRPHCLTGIHAALELDEVTLIIVPDAVQRGWIHRGIRPPPAPVPSPPLSQPDWSHFLDCHIRVIEPPSLLSPTCDSLGTVILKWGADEDNLTFVLEEATRAGFEDAIAIYAGSEYQYTLYGHTPGVFYYRVRGFVGDQSTDWSNGVVVSIDAPSPYQLKSIQTEISALIESYSDETLLKVQRAVLRLCAARGDLFAVLALPEHYRADEMLAHIQTLTAAGSGFWGVEEPRTLSFGALYHPWLIGREENRLDELRRTPPDGAMAGIIAQRTLARGAWLAPANEFLKGVVALTPLIDRSRWHELQDAQLNLIRHEPKGFTAMNSDTLTSDEDLRPINVRRLLMLLRRLAQRLGVRYVFEPNDAAFRRSVQRGFEALLDGLFLRGAFAGATAETSYKVVTDTSVNTPEAVDQGRFTVELRVAPSLPLRFMTIRLLQTGDRTLVTEET